MTFFNSSSESIRTERSISSGIVKYRQRVCFLTQDFQFKEFRHIYHIGSRAL